MSEDIHLTKQDGIIGYWPALKMFTVNFSKPASFDSQVTGVVDGRLDDAFKKEGAAVTFAGRLYRNAQTPKAVLGGQQVYWLEVSEIRLRQVSR